MKVLIAEDDIMNQMLMGKYMRTLGWEHTIVANGLLAVEACQSTNFDAILMDIEMPELDGISATRNIREFNKTIPIIAITAYVNEKNINECNKSGMNSFLAKPVSQDTIKNIITEFVNSGI
jgi:CheY-like chemotaxis protein